MAKKMCIGVNNKAQKGKKMYIGVSDKARKIRKMYIGVNGVARCFYRSDYKAVVLDSNHAFWSSNVFRGGTYSAATTVGDYAVFAGGYDDTGTYTYYRGIYACNKSLTVTTKSMDVSISSMAATTVGDYALFGGGIAGSSYHDAIRVYDKSLTRIDFSGTLGFGATDLGATSIGDYAVFGGGYNRAGSYRTDVTAINKNLVKYSGSLTLAIARAYLKAVSIGNYALFPYGTNSSYSSKNIETFDKSLTRGSVNGGNICRRDFGATANEKYAIIGGGITYAPSSDGIGTTSSISNDVHALNTSLTKVSVDSLHSGYTTSPCQATTVNDLSIFIKPNSTQYAVYDLSLVRTIQDSGKDIGTSYSAASIGDYAIFNKEGSSATAAAEIFQTIDA